jgi:hypothetical protein
MPLSCCGLILASPQAMILPNIILFPSQPETERPASYFFQVSLRQRGLIGKRSGTGYCVKFYFLCVTLNFCVIDNAGEQSFIQIVVKFLHAHLTIQVQGVPLFNCCCHACERVNVLSRLWNRDSDCPGYYWYIQLPK